MIRNILILILATTLAFHYGRLVEYKSYQHYISMYNQVQAITDTINQLPVAAMK